MTEPLDLAHLRALCEIGSQLRISAASLRALLDRLERAEAAWLYLGERIQDGDEISNFDLRRLCDGHHVGGPICCDRCGGVM